MRALATDNAGNTTASAVQTNRRIDNAGPVVAITSPIAGRVRGVVTLDGTATDPVGVSLVTFEYRQGAGAWQRDLQRPDRVLHLRHDRHHAASPTAPTSCACRPPTRSGTRRSRRPSSVIIDNTAPTATNVQAANVGTAGTINADDTLTFTWSEPMAPASILTGWTGAPQNIRVRVTNVGATDTLDLYNAAGTTKLNVMAATQALRLQADWVSATADFNATMTMSRAAASMITIGTLISGTPRTGVTTAANMIWNPSTARDRRASATPPPRPPHRDRRRRPRLLAARRRRRAAPDGHLRVLGYCQQRPADRDQGGVE